MRRPREDRYVRCASRLPGLTALLSVREPWWPSHWRALRGTLCSVLKPGGRFLFVEMLRGACQGTLGIIEQEPGWQVDADQAWKTMFNDPHAIGVAVKVPPASASIHSARTHGLCMAGGLTDVRACVQKGALQVGEPDRAEQLEAKLKGGRRRK